MLKSVVANVERVEILPHGSLGTATACNFEIQSTGSGDDVCHGSQGAAATTSNLAILSSLDVAVAVADADAVAVAVADAVAVAVAFAGGGDTQFADDAIVTGLPLLLVVAGELELKTLLSSQVVVPNADSDSDAVPTDAGGTVVVVAVAVSEGPQSFVEEEFPKLVIVVAGVAVVVVSL